MSWYNVVDSQKGSYRLRLNLKSFKSALSFDPYFAMLHWEILRLQLQVDLPHFNKIMIVGKNGKLKIDCKPCQSTQRSRGQPWWARIEPEHPIDVSTTTMLNHWHCCRSPMLPIGPLLPRCSGSEAAGAIWLGMIELQVKSECPLVTAARPVARRGSCDGLSRDRSRRLTSDSTWVHRDRNSFRTWPRAGPP